MAAADALVLLGGMMCDERLWAPQLEGLANGSRAIEVADLARSPTVEGMAADVLAEAPERFALAGMSMGGIVAFEMWRQAPERISHLALLDTNSAAELPERQERRRAEIEAAHAGGLREMMIEEFKPIYLGARSKRDAGLLDLILDMALALGPEVFERQSRALRDRPDSRPTLATITCPSIVICGREDTLCPVSYHEIIAAAIPGAELVVLDDCGHMSPLERPGAVTRLLEELMRRQCLVGSRR